MLYKAWFDTIWLVIREGVNKIRVEKSRRGWGGVVEVNAKDCGWYKFGGSLWKKEVYA